MNEFPYRHQFQYHPEDVRVDVNKHNEVTIYQESTGEVLASFYSGRWRIAGCGLCSRDDVERAIPADKGFLDGVEAAAESVHFEWLELQKERRKHEMEKEGYFTRMSAIVEQNYKIQRHALLSERQGSDDVPEVLSDIRKVSRDGVSYLPRVYFLLKDGVVVYVGQTTTPWPSRIIQHQKDPSKEFDDVWSVECDEKSLGEVERAYIQKFQPIYNRAMKK